MLLLSLAGAAELTYIPQLWRGDITVGYGYGWERGHLVEPDPDPAIEDHRVALQMMNEHFITIGAMGTILPGVAVGFAVRRGHVAQGLEPLAQGRVGVVGQAVVGGSDAAE